MKVKFYTSERGSKVALWVAADDLDISGRNIWDLKKKEMTPDVMMAIRSAFHRGVEFHREMMRNIAAESISAEDGWEHYGKGK